MKYDPEKRHRRSIRLKGYDYAQPGAYFVTICTQNRQCLFGNVVDGNMMLNRFGEIVWSEWFRTARIRPYVQLYESEFVVMPNHVHGIIWIVDSPNHDVNTVGATGRSPLPDGPQYPRGPKSQSLGAIIAGFKSAVTRRINNMRGTPGTPVWQRNYYEHIVRDENELNRIREYINNNPLQWALDRENPDVRTTGRSSRPKDEPWRI